MFNIKKKPNLGTLKAPGHSEGTQALEANQRTKGTQGTRGLKHLRPSGTQTALRHLVAQGTWPF